MKFEFMRKWLKQFKFKEDWGELALVLSPIIFSSLFGFPQIIDFFGINWFIAIVSLAAITTLLGWIKSIKNKKSISSLSGDLINLEFQKEHLEGILISLPEDLCRLLANKWKLNGDSRITIYRYTSDHFIPVSRYSKNPDFDKFNRSHYPKDVGYINMCWAADEGVYFNDLPDPIENEREYIEHVSKETGMLKKDLRELSMKSRSYYGKTLYDNNSKAFLIVMIESMRRDIHSIEEIINDLDGIIAEFLVSVVGSNIVPKGGGGNYE